MGIIFCFQLPRSLPKFLTKFLLILTILLVPGSDSHFILNNCSLGYCHQSDVSKLPQVISDNCKRINIQ